MKATASFRECNRVDLCVAMIVVWLLLLGARVVRAEPRLGEGRVVSMFDRELFATTCWTNLAAIDGEMEFRTTAMTAKWSDELVTPLTPPGAVLRLAPATFVADAQPPWVSERDLMTSGFAADVLLTSDDEGITKASPPSAGHLRFANAWREMNSSSVIHGPHIRGFALAAIIDGSLSRSRDVETWGDTGMVSAMSRRFGGVPVGEGFVVVGETMDTMYAPTLLTPNAVRYGMVESRDPWLVSRVGVEHEIMPDVITGFYSFEHASRYGYDSDPWTLSSPWNVSIGENHRAGLRTQSADGRWAFAATGFYAESGNSDSFLAPPEFNWHRGVELAVQAGVTPRWKTTVRLTEVQSRLSSNEHEGWTPPKKQSTASATIWNRFTIYRHDDRELILGLGTKLVAEHKDGYADSMILPGFSRWDLGLFYRHTGLESRLYIQSILDSGYYHSFDSLWYDSDSPLAIKAQLHLEY